MICKLVQLVDSLQMILKKSLFDNHSYLLFFGGLIIMVFISQLMLYGGAACLGAFSNMSRINVKIHKIEVHANNGHVWSLVSHILAKSGIYMCALFA